MKNRNVIVLLCGVIFTAACSSPSVGGKSWSEFTAKSFRDLDPKTALSDSGIPLLVSDVYEKKWGAPERSASSAGFYKLNYENSSGPFDRLVIYGSKKAFPKLATAPPLLVADVTGNSSAAIKRPQSFRTTMIAGQKVNWFQESASGGADGAYFSTTGFALKDASGKIGYYRLVIETGDDNPGIGVRFGSVNLKR